MGVNNSISAKQNLFLVQTAACTKQHERENFCLNKSCKQGSLFCQQPFCSKRHINCDHMKISDIIKFILHLENIQLEYVRAQSQRIKLNFADYLLKQYGASCVNSFEEIQKYMQNNKIESVRNLRCSNENIENANKSLQAQYQKILINLNENLNKIEKDITSRFIRQAKAPYKIYGKLESKEVIQKLIVHQEKNKNLKILSLDATNKEQKLTADDIKQFAKVVLPNVENISLKGNAVGDQGIQVLCQANYENLKQINLNDNQIGVKGVSALVNNTWSKQVEYKLQAAITKDGGYALKAGKSVKTMKTLIKSSKSIDSKAIDELQQKNKKQLFQSMHLMMETPLQGKPQQILNESQEMSKELEEAVKLKPVSIERVLLTLKETFQSTEVTFSKTTNARSQLSIKILSTWMEQQTVMIKHRVFHKKWNFKDFKNNSAKVVEFQEWYKQKLAKKYDADISDITIHKITEGSIIVLMSMSIDNPLLKNKEFSSKEQIKVVPFFAAFNLSMDDFDSQYDFDFPKNDKCENQWRGGIPYFQPVHCSRIAINVLNFYDYGDNDWISMAGVAGQYGVAFHGVKAPAQYVPDKTKTVLESIMSGRKYGEMLKGGEAQAYSKNNAINKNGQKVGDGVYLSPKFTTALLEYTRQCTKLKNQAYRVVFQVRFKPEALKCPDMTHRDDYWVINKSRDVRPYGVILFTPQQFQLLNSKKDTLYTRKMDWESWKKQYQEFRKRHNLPL